MMFLKGLVFAFAVCWCAFWSFVPVILLLSFLFG